MFMDEYPGDKSLPEATRFRIEASFKEALSLYLNGNYQDCIMGCDFILKMDPKFEPAKILMEKCQNPSSEVDLRPIIEKYGEKEKINIEELLIEALELYNNREFQKAIEILNKILLHDPNNSEAREMFDRTKEKLEIQAFVNQFIKRAKEYLEEGTYEDALKEINKGLALDETNPELLELKEKTENLLKEIKEAEKIEEKTGFEVEAPSAEIPSFEIVKEEIKEAPEEVPFEKFEEALEEPISKKLLEEKPPEYSEKIKNLLSEGERAFQLGEYQEAIDIWSRIFLLDINNEEASRRIEEAKLKIAEEERKIEELYSIALSLFQQGKKEEAKKQFQEILNIHPHHIGARNYLRQIEEEEEAKEKLEIKPPIKEEPIKIEEILPEIPKVPEIPEAPPKRKNIIVPILGAAGFILILILGWILIEGGKKTPQTLSPNLLLIQAKGLMDEGKYEQALPILQKITPDSKEYQEALSLIEEARKKMAMAKKETIDGKPLEVVFNEYRQKAYEAFKMRDYEKAEEYYKKAQELKPLPFEDKAFYEDVQKIINQVNTAKSYFSSGNYEQAIALMEPVYAEDKIVQAKNILVNSNYNLGVLKLKEENLKEAYNYFKEVLKYEPNDEMAKKNIKFIERYKEAKKDLLYQIYIKYLSLR